MPTSGRRRSSAARTREVVLPGTYHVEPSNPQLGAIFLAPMRGFLRMGAIIGLIFIVGGAFNILNDTGAIAAGIHQLVKLLGHRSYLIIPIVMTVFSFFGGAYGMAEEAIPFALIFVPLALALGYDSIVGVCLSFVAAGVGFSAGFLNPFTVQISQAIAGVPLGSGIYYRILVWIIATALAIVWVMVYAARVKADPTRSPMYDLDRQRREEIGKAEAEQVVFTWRHGLCLLVLLGAVVGLIVGSTVYKWYMVEFAGLFFAMGVLAGLAAGIGPNRLAKSFITGAKDLAGAALIVAFAGGIVVILEDGHILDTILYGMASVTSHFGGVLAAQAMYVLQLHPELLHPVGLHQGRADHAAARAARGPLGDHPADARARLPARRRLQQHDPPDLGGHGRHAGAGQDPLRALGEVELAAAGRLLRALARGAGLARARRLDGNPLSATCAPARGRQG